MLPRIKIAVVPVLDSVWADVSEQVDQKRLVYCISSTPLYSKIYKLISIYLSPSLDPTLILHDLY